MRNILTLILLMMIIGCMHVPPSLVPEESSNNRVKVAKIGALVDKKENVFYVQKVFPKSQAENYGIRVNDIIYKVDNVKIKDLNQLRELVGRFVYNNKPLEYEIIRDGNHITLYITPIVVEIYPTIDKITKIASSSPISLAIIAGDVYNSLQAPPNFDKDSWYKSVKNGMTSSAERELLNGAPPDGFKLIDRNIIDKIIEEQKISQSGLVSAEFRTKIGKMYGVTHIMICSLSRYGIGGTKGYVDELTRKLINIENGSIEATDYIKSVYK
ncbi:MAG: PDZ domain-containing protein [Bacteroidota bacterium]